MTRLEALIGLNMFCDIGSTRLNQLLKFFGKPENILKAPCEKLMAVSGIGKEIARKVTSLKEEDIDEDIDLAKKYNLKIITIDDEEYPENLKQIYDPPIVLYVKGELTGQDKFSIAIVGSRRASFYGLSCAEKFASDLSERNFTIVSGLARGIDTSAHRGALKQGGRTIAVIGSGFRHLYPQENKELAEEISRCGAVISEFPINARPLSQNFPRRNRVISGLSLGVLVVEAARNSGALITADCALEQGRDVFALPGKIDSGNSFGTNGLIKQGAKLVSCADDIIEEFNIPITTNLNKREIKDTNLDSNVCLSDNESLLYNLISGQPVLLDEIAEKTNMSISAISDMLLRLQLKKMIRQLPGKQFIKNPV
jgi:DNA processing protein